MVGPERASCKALAVLAAVSSLVLALTVGPALAQAQTDDVATEVRVPTVTVASVVKAEVVGQIAVSGSLVARDEVLIYPQVSGFTIESLAARVGDSVVAGEVVATLATRNLDVQVMQANAEITRAEAGIRQAESQINTAQANLTQAESQLSRRRELEDRGVGTQADLDDAIAAAETARASFASATDGLAVAQAQRDQAQAQLDLATLNLDHAQIRTPADGIVSARNGQIGAIASSGGEPIYRIIVDGAVDVELEIIESALGAVSVDDPVSLNIASVGSVSGAVSRISPTVDPTTRLATVTVEVPSTPGLRPGLFASGTIETARRDSLTVPATAVLTDSDGAYVLRVRDGLVDRRPVVAGLIWRNAREILEGVTEGETVIARAGAFFTDGDVVNTVPADPGPARAEASAAGTAEGADR